MAFRVPEKYRIKTGFNGSDETHGNNGAFSFRISHKAIIVAIASDGMGWEHVSVSVREGGKPRIPTWDEMCRVKDMFWGDEDTVVQYHPPKSEYVNNHPCVLHLWRQVGVEFPRPLPIMVGIVGLENAGN